jgi:hypothetical protein
LRPPISLAPTATATLVSWVHVFEDRQFAENARAFLEAANEQNLERLTREVGNAPSKGA